MGGTYLYWAIISLFVVFFILWERENPLSEKELRRTYIKIFAFSMLFSLVVFLLVEAGVRVVAGENISGFRKLCLSMGYQSLIVILELIFIGLGGWLFLGAPFFYIFYKMEQQKAPKRWDLAGFLQWISDPSNKRKRWHSILWVIGLYILFMIVNFVFMLK